MKTSGDKRKTLFAADLFYRIFGGVFALAGGWFFIVCLTVVLEK